MTRENANELFDLIVANYFTKMKKSRIQLNIDSQIMFYMLLRRLRKEAAWGMSSCASRATAEGSAQAMAQHQYYKNVHSFLNGVINRDSTKYQSADLRLIIMEMYNIIGEPANDSIATTDTGESVAVSGGIGENPQGDNSVSEEAGGTLGTRDNHVSGSRRDGEKGAKKRGDRAKAFRKPRHASARP